MSPRRTAAPSKATERFDPGACHQVREVLDLVGDTWSVLILRVLAEDKIRFNELRRSMPGISQRMLTRNLRILERDGLLTRTAAPSVPPNVSYALTPLGKSLKELAVSLTLWTTNNFSRIAEAQSTFDRLESATIAANC
jgi:DNA-binding HxlR family transcriptional regulator